MDGENDEIEPIKVPPPHPPKSAQKHKIEKPKDEIHKNTEFIEKVKNVHKNKK